LSQNYPNPFNPTTKMSYSLKFDNIVKITMYDLLGKEMAVLVNDFKQTGAYEYILDANKLNLSSGIYFYRIESGAFRDTKKIILIK